MRQPEWYSSQLRFVSLVEGIGASLYTDQVHVFRAVDTDDAMARALSIGHDHEDEYLNANGQRLRWRLKEIRTLDAIGPTIADGAEIHSAFADVPSDEHVGANATFEPERSQPGNSM